VWIQYKKINIKRRREKAKEEIEKECEWILQLSGFGGNRFKKVEEADVPDAGYEFLVWDELDKGRYWRAISSLNILQEREGLGRIGDKAELELLAKEAVKQTMGGY
jgi:hypothetical protein